MAKVDKILEGLTTVNEGNKNKIVKPNEVVASIFRGDQFLQVGKLKLDIEIIDLGYILGDVHVYYKIKNESKEYNMILDEFIKTLKSSGFKL
jgi:hypothetical protein